MINNHGNLKFKYDHVVSLHYTSPTVKVKIYSRKIASKETDTEVKDSIYKTVAVTLEDW